jgi:glycosyltransferase involved in cell wall biosynthesis
MPQGIILKNGVLYMDNIAATEGPSQAELAQIEADKQARLAKLEAALFSEAQNLYLPETGDHQLFALANTTETFSVTDKSPENNSVGSVPETGREPLTRSTDQVASFHENQLEELRELKQSEYGDNAIRSLFSPKAREENQIIENAFVVYEKELESFKAMEEPTADDVSRLTQAHASVNSLLTQGITNESQFAAIGWQAGAETANIVGQATDEGVRYTTMAYAMAQTGGNVKMSMLAGNAAAATNREARAQVSNLTAALIDPKGATSQQLQNYNGTFQDRLVQAGTETAIGLINPAMNNPLARAGVTGGITGTSSILTDVANGRDVNWKASGLSTVTGVAGTSAGTALEKYLDNPLTAQAAGYVYDNASSIVEMKANGATWEEAFKQTARSNVTSIAGQTAMMGMKPETLTHVAGEKKQESTNTLSDGDTGNVKAEDVAGIVANGLLASENSGPQSDGNNIPSYQPPEIESENNNNTGSTGNVEETSNTEENEDNLKSINVAFITNELPLEKHPTISTHPTSLGGGGMYADAVPPALIENNAVDSLAYYVPGSRGILQTAELFNWNDTGLRVHISLSKSPNSATASENVTFRYLEGEHKGIPVFTFDDLGNRWIKTSDGNKSLRELDFFGGELFNPEVQNTLNYATLMFMKSQLLGPDAISEKYPKFYEYSSRGNAITAQFKPSVIMNGIHHLIGKVNKDIDLRGSLSGLDVLHVFDGYDDPGKAHYFNTIYSSEANKQIFDLTKNSVMASDGRIVVNAALVDHLYNSKLDQLTEAFGVDKDIDSLYRSFSNPLNIDHPVDTDFMAAHSNFYSRPLNNVDVYGPYHTSRMNGERVASVETTLPHSGKSPDDFGFRQLPEELEIFVNTKDAVTHPALREEIIAWKNDNKMALQRLLELPVDPQSNILAFTSRPRFKYKIFHTTLVSVDQYLKQDPSNQFVIVADIEAAFDRAPVEMMDSLIERYPDQVRHIRFDKQAQFFAGNGSDFILMTSTLETFGMANTAAMASGAPVIASPVGGVITTTYDPTKTHLLETFINAARRYDHNHPNSDFLSSLLRHENTGRNAIWIDQPTTEDIEIERRTINGHFRNAFEHDLEQMPPNFVRTVYSIDSAIGEAISLSTSQKSDMVLSGLAFTHQHLSPEAIAERYGKYIRENF